MTAHTHSRDGQSRVVYLDANATEPLRPQARDALLEAADMTGNPSSVHRAGRMARAVLESARDTVAQMFEVEPLNCIFTSGGTEANVLAMHGLGQGRRFLVGRRNMTPCAKVFLMEHWLTGCRSPPMGK